MHILNQYFYVCGRCNIRSIESTIQQLSSCVPTEIYRDPYCALIYMRIREHTKKMIHRNIGQYAAKQGEYNLATICASIARDEAQCEKAHQVLVSKLLQEDPNGMLTSFEKVIRYQSSLIHPEQMFINHTTTAQQLSVY